MMAAAAAAVVLAAAPAHVALFGAAQQTIHLTNAGTVPVVVEATRAGFSLDLRGRPRVAPKGESAWLQVTPRRIAVPAGGAASLTVSSTVPHGASAGDHPALLLLTTRPRRGRAVSVRMRIGIVVVLRVPGAVVHRVELRSLHVGHAGRARLLRVSLANRGNVTEVLHGLHVLLRRGGRIVARLQPGRRELLPRTRGVAEVRYTGPLRGWVTAVVELPPATRSGVPRRRAFRVRL